MAEARKSFPVSLSRNVRLAVVACRLLSPLRAHSTNGAEAKVGDQGSSSSRGQFHW